MKILVKFPTRERPVKFAETLRGYIDNAANNKDIHYMITVDDNDHSMKSASIGNLLDSYPNVSVHSGMSLSKINAINRDLYKCPVEWDMLVLASDDMICQQHAWDTILRMEMVANFPNTDGVLWHWDGDPNTKGKLNTMCILGRKYFDRFGYIYHPSYTSLWCDNEFTEVARKLNKVYFSEQILFKHVHFSNTPGLQPDALMQRTQGFYHADEHVYKKRAARNFDLV